MDKITKTRIINETEYGSDASQFKIATELCFNKFIPTVKFEAGYTNRDKKKSNSENMQNKDSKMNENRPNYPNLPTYNPQVQNYPIVYNPGYSGMTQTYLPYQYFQAKQFYPGFVPNPMYQAQVINPSYQTEQQGQDEQKKGFMSNKLFNVFKKNNKDQSNQSKTKTKKPRLNRPVKMEIWYR